MSQNFKYTAAITNTPVLVTAQFKFILYFDAFNGSEACYVQMFDVADAGDVTLGVTTPDWVFCVPESGGHSEVYGANDYFTGLKFSNGLVIAATTTRGGSTAPGSSTDINLAML